MIRLKHSIRVVLALLLLAFVNQGFAERKALLIGINTYHPPQGQKENPKAWRSGWSDLDGAVNDVTRVGSLLKARYGFDDGNIQLVTDRDATRARILAELQRFFVDEVAAGDTLFFYYAGHGSQVTNLLSKEYDKRDETIVPADSWNGVEDIRDKELKRFFNRALAKGARLTATFDSCHSGSVHRGPTLRKRKLRKAPPAQETISVADPDNEPRPEENHNAVIISAAQDFQPAEERAGIGPAAGAFSWAFAKVLSEASPSEPVQDIFRRVGALLKSENYAQIPVLAASEVRRKRNLLGDETKDDDGLTRVAVLQKTRGGEITLDGGQALGINPGAELTLKKGEQELVLRVARVGGLSESTATVVKGTLGAINVGDLFAVSKWVASQQELIRIWVPQDPPSMADMRRIPREIYRLRRANTFSLLEDPAAATPTHWVYWDSDGWMLESETESVSLGRQFLASAISKHLPKDAKLLVNLPLPREVATRLDFARTSNAVRPVGDMFSAHYLLAGRYGSDGWSYALMLPGFIDADANRMAMPVRTDWKDMEPGGDPLELTQWLQDKARRLAKIKGWLQLAPGAGQSKPFPYRLALSSETEDKLEGELQAGDIYGLKLVAEEKDLEGGVLPRFVYVFIIDRNGNSALLFPPRGAGSVENQFPPRKKRGTKHPTSIQLGPKQLFRISPPFGVDTYVMLTSEDPLPNPGVLTFSGVRTRGARSGNALQNLLEDVSTATRGAESVVPANWSIQRSSFRSLE